MYWSLAQPVIGVWHNRLLQSGTDGNWSVEQPVIGFWNSQFIRVLQLFQTPKHLAVPTVWSLEQLCIGVWRSQLLECGTASY